MQLQGRKYIIFLIFVGIVFQPSAGQTAMPLIAGIFPADSILADSLVHEANYFLGKDSLDRSLGLASEALQVSMRSDVKGTEQIALDLMAKIYNRRGKYGDAIPYYLRKADLIESGGDTTALKDLYRKVALNYQREEIYEKEAAYLKLAFNLTAPANSKERSLYLQEMGVALFNAEMVDSSIVLLKEARKICLESQLDDTELMEKLVMANNRAGHFDQALQFNEMLFDRYRENEDYNRMSALMNNIGYNHTQLGEYGQAADAYILAIKYGKQAGLPAGDLSIMYSNAGVCYLNQRNHTDAKKYFRMSLKADREAGQFSEKSRIENILALTYFHEGDLYNASHFSKNSIESASIAGDPEHLSEGYLTYSRILREGNNPILALEYYEKYLAIRDSMQIEDKLKERSLAARKYELEKSEQDLKIKLKEEQVKELAIRQLTLQLEKEEREKELISKEKDVQLLEKERLRQSILITQKEHEAESQRRQNKILEQENRISELRLEQEVRKQKEQEQEIQLLEQQKKMNQLELERQKTAKKALLWITGLGILIAVMILWSLITTRKKNLLLARQKLQIEEKNKDLEQKNEEITSQRDEIEAQRNLVFEQKEKIEQINLDIRNSIEYAKKIQSSTLPDLSLLDNIIKEYFVLFQPRDIVSGDFYWLAEVEKHSIITVADCTGHGVPGAFMSILGMSLLKEVVQKEYITHPGVILRRIRKEVISALGQKGISGEQRDGMDMSLISISHETRRLEYSGANNPLYLLRFKDQAPPLTSDYNLLEPEDENPYMLYEIRPDKMPIAHYERMDKFTTHEIELLEGDCLYLFTDGYADQFGGKRGKKLMYKPFKRLILRNAHLPMDEQRQVLQETIADWMGDFEQVDDICIMGLKI